MVLWLRARYELLAKGKLPKQLAEPVPDVYLRNQELDEQVQTLREQVSRARGNLQAGEVTTGTT